MALKPLLLTRAGRQGRRDLILFLDLVLGLLLAGFELSYAWEKAFQALKDELAKGPVFEVLELAHGERFGAFLQKLAISYPAASHRIWFGVLAELSDQGAALGPTLSAFIHALRDEQERDWQVHLRSLPTKNSIVLALCFLLPALALIFVPLLAQMSASFG